MVRRHPPRVPEIARSLLAVETGYHSEQPVAGPHLARVSDHDEVTTGQSSDAHYPALDGAHRAIRSDVDDPHARLGRALLEVAIGAREEATIGGPGEGGEGVLAAASERAGQHLDGAVTEVNDWNVPVRVVAPDRDARFARIRERQPRVAADQSLG